MHRDTLNTKYDADVQGKRLVRSMGFFFQKLGVNKKFFHIISVGILYFCTGRFGGKLCFEDLAATFFKKNLLVILQKAEAA